MDIKDLSNIEESDLQICRLINSLVHERPVMESIVFDWSEKVLARRNVRNYATRILEYLDWTEGTGPDPTFIHRLYDCEGPGHVYQEVAA